MTLEAFTLGRLCLGAGFCADGSVKRLVNNVVTEELEKQRSSRLGTKIEGTLDARFRSKLIYLRLPLCCLGLVTWNNARLVIPNINWSLKSFRKKNISRTKTLQRLYKAVKNTLDALGTI